MADGNETNKHERDAAMTTDTAGIDRIDAITQQAEEIIEAAGHGVSAKTLTTTRDTIEQFAAAWGAGKTDPDIDMPHRVWHDVQIGGKGTPRGTLVVLDFGDWRVANFC